MSPNISSHVSEHFLRPHAPGIGALCEPGGGVVGRQEPRFDFPLLPVGEKIGAIGMALSQQDVGNPPRVSRIADETVESLSLSFPLLDEVASLLTERIPPSPRVQLAQDIHGPKLAISDQRDGCFFGDERVDIAQ